MKLISLSLPPLPNPSVSQASVYMIHLYSLNMFFFSSLANQRFTARRLTGVCKSREMVCIMSRQPSVKSRGEQFVQGISIQQFLLVWFTKRQWPLSGSNLNLSNFWDFLSARNILRSSNFWPLLINKCCGSNAAISVLCHLCYASRRRVMFVFASSIGLV